jgi:membrane protease YdiL (CAAX protease family)
MPQQHTISPLATDKSPWTSLALVFFLVVLGAFLGQVMASMLYSLGTGDNIAEAIHTALPPKRLLLMLQAITASSAFIVAPLLYLHLFTQQSFRALFQWHQSYVAPILVTLSLVLAFMVVDTWFIQWNMTIQLPNWLSLFEVWAQEKEATLQKITALLTSFDSLIELGVGILVIGIIPAIGEELLFRGLVQNICHKLTHNIHLAIGMSAFVFSAIHLQFYGFLPRFLLGVLFGYIYWWTKDLLFPMVAHLFNNTFVLLMLFLHQQKIITQDISTFQAPSVPVLIFFAAMVVALANLLRQQGKHVD